MVNYDVGGGVYNKVRWQTMTWKVGLIRKTDGELHVLLPGIASRFMTPVRKIIRRPMVVR
jgi:hypothetical protein